MLAREIVADRDLYEIVEEVNRIHKPMRLVGSSQNAVLVSENEWNSIQETLYLLSIPNMRESIVDGLNTPLDECSKEVEW